MVSTVLIDKNAAIAAIKRPEINEPQMTDQAAKIVPLSRITGSLGFGWVEDHYTDDQGVEGLTLEECVWIYGLIIDTDGCRIDKDYTRSHYGKRHGLRVWDSKPTEAQRQEAEWHD